MIHIITMQGRYVEALQDVSAAIHLDPNGAQAFYHRACLLRTSQPEQSLQDLSVSLLLDDSVANVSAYIHRGVLYTQMKWSVKLMIFSQKGPADNDTNLRLRSCCIFFLPRQLSSPHPLAGKNQLKTLPLAANCSFILV